MSNSGALLLRNGIAYAGKAAWTPAHLRWLADLKLPLPVQQIGLQKYLHSTTDRPSASRGWSRPCVISCPVGTCARRCKP